MKKRGITLVETVIAMLLLTIVTGTMFAVCSSSANRVANSSIEFASTSACEDVAVCFRTADTFDTFQALLAASGYENCVFEQIANESGATVYSAMYLSDGGFSVAMQIEGVDNWATAKLTLTAERTTTNGTLYQLVCTKGGGNG